MKRVKTLFKQRRFQVLIALSAVVVAVGVVASSGASFTAQQANPTNVFTSGTLSMGTNNSGALAQFTNMVPGDSQVGTVTIQNTGNVQGAFYLDAATFAGSSALADALDLVITDTATPGTPEYSGPISGLTTQVALGTWAASESHTYTFTTTLSDSADNSLQGLTASAAFAWTTVSVPTSQVTTTPTP